MTDKKKKIYCNFCKRTTNHILIGEHSNRDYEEQEGQIVFWEEDRSILWICAGCESGTLEKGYTYDSMTDSNGKQIYDSTYHPARKYQHLKFKHFLKLPIKLKRLYMQTIKAYNYKMSILCAGGLRALVEGICVDKQITGKTLKNKIDNMVTILPENIVKNLHGFRFMGNVALHQLEPPDRKILGTAIEVSEDLMNYLYELDYKASKLAREKKDE